MFPVAPTQTGSQGHNNEFTTILAYVRRNCFWIPLAISYCG
jgi:hypothetical protein